MGGEILVAQSAADAPEIRIYCLRDLAFIEGIATALSDQAIGIREIDIAEDLPFFGGAPRDQISCARIVEFLDQVDALLECRHLALPIG